MELLPKEILFILDTRYYFQLQEGHIQTVEKIQCEQPDQVLELAPAPEWFWEAAWAKKGVLFLFYEWHNDRKTGILAIGDPPNLLSEWDYVAMTTEKEIIGFECQIFEQMHPTVTHHEHA